MKKWLLVLLLMCTQAQALISEPDQASLGIDKNYLANGGCEQNTTGWSAFHTTFTNGVPGTITLGSTKLGFARATTNVLQGNASCSINLTTASGSTGHGVISPVMVLKDADLAKQIASQFDYNFVTGAFNVDVSGTSTQTLEVWIYNVGLASWYQPAGFRSINTLNVPGRTPSITFQSDSSNAVAKNEYRIALIIRNDPAGTFTFNFDNVVFGRQKKAFGPAVTDLVSDTPSGSLTTNVTYTGYHRRVGDSLEGEILVSFSGANTDGAVTLNLPPGFTIDTAKLANSATDGSEQLGWGTYLRSGVANYPLSLKYNSTTSFSVRVNNATGTYDTDTSMNTNTNTPATVGAGDKIQVFYRVPIVGWSSNTQMSQDTDTRVVATYTSGSSTTVGVTPTTIVPTTIVQDTHAGFNGSGVYTVPVSGFYSFGAQLEVSTSTTFVQLYYSKNGGGSVQFASTQINTTATFNTVTGSAVLLLNAGDTLAIQGEASTSSSIQAFNSFIYRLSGPSVIAANETVSANYFAASATITGSFSAVTYSTKSFDSHSGYSGSTYTIPVSGKYQINASLAITGTFAADNVGEIAIFKNGSQVTQGTAQTGASATLSVPTTSQIIDCVAGDTIQIQAKSNASSPSVSASNFRNVFSLARVGN